MGPAPADALPHAPWPMWKKIFAYSLLAAVAAAAIWYVDLKAHRPPDSDAVGPARERSE